MVNFSCIYRGYVSHRRHIVSESSKRANAFKYPVMYFYLDLDEINSTFTNIPFVSINGYNIISWFRNHYICNSNQNHNQSLSDCIKDLVYLHCNKRPDQNGKVCLLTMPTQFGYGFNPVSMFYCFNAQNTKIQALVCEVHNTPWLDTHCYVLPFFECDNDLLSAQWAKAFHVSPFYTMDYQYVWSFNNPHNEQNTFKSFGCLLKPKHKMETNVDVKQHPWGTSSVAHSIDLHKNEIDYHNYIKAFDFGFRDMIKMEINIKTMLLFMLHSPMMSAMTQLWIHWQTMRVYWKGITVHQNPQNKDVNAFIFLVKHFLIICGALIAIVLSIIPCFLANLYFNIYSTTRATRTNRRPSPSPSPSQPPEPTTHIMILDDEELQELLTLGNSC
eukprot:986934_1